MRRRNMLIKQITNSFNLSKYKIAPHNSKKSSPKKKNQTSILNNCQEILVYIYIHLCLFLAESKNQRIEYSLNRCSENIEIQVSYLSFFAV